MIHSQEGAKGSKASLGLQDILLFLDIESEMHCLLLLLLDIDLNVFFPHYYKSEN